MCRWPADISVRLILLTECYSRSLRVMCRADREGELRAKVWRECGRKWAGVQEVARAKAGREWGASAARVWRECGVSADESAA